MKTKLSLEEISQRWISEGKIFKDAINARQQIFYAEGKEPDTPEPRDTRADLAELVMAQVQAFNKRREYETLRKLFPPHHEPLNSLFEQDLFEVVSKVMILPDNRIVAKAGSKCYIIQEYIITELPGLISFGTSPDKKEFALAYKDYVEVKEGWDGLVINKVPYPSGYGKDFVQLFPGLEIDWRVFTGEELHIVDIKVFPGGKRLLLNTRRGVFVINAESYQLVHPFIPSFKEIEEPWIMWPKNTSNEEEEEDEPYALDFTYSHADLSPDGKYIATGSQDSDHIVLEEKNNIWTEIVWIESRSDYPNAAKFNYRISIDGQPAPALAFSSCHMSGSATTGIPVKELVPGLKASAYNLEPEALWVIDDNFWVNCILDWENSFVLGTAAGYILIKLHDQDVNYLSLGGSVQSMDVTMDRKQLIIGNSFGQVIKLKFSPVDNLTKDNNGRQDPNLVTNTSWVDEIRYLFPKGKQPLIW